MTSALDWQKDGPTWPHNASSRFLAAGGLTWHVQEMGSGPVALLIHGTGASTHSFAGLAPMLARQFRVVMLDLPGHGFTGLPDAERLSLPGMAASIGDVLSSLRVYPAIAVGHSAGAAILARMCLDRRIDPQTLVSINGALLPLRSFAFQFFSPLAKLLFVNPLVPRFFAWSAIDARRVEQLISGTGSKISPDGLAYYRRLFQCPTHVTGALGMMANWDLEGLVRDLPGLRTHIVLVAGGSDTAIPADDAYRVRDLVTASRVVFLADRGHLAHEERPEQISEIIVAAFSTAAAQGQGAP